MRLHHLARTWRHAADETLRDLGVSEASAWPLRLLHGLGDGVRQGALAEAAGVEGPSLVRQIDTLEAKGLVRRQEDEADRRAKNVHLTDQGRSKVVEIEDALGKLRDRLLKEVPDEDIEVVLRVFDRLEAVMAADRARGGGR